MKKFIIKCLIFLMIFYISDLCIGIILNHLSQNAKSGGNLKNNNIAYNINEKILIFGSSRAAHHYKPYIFEDSLNLSTYNCGRDGNGIILMYGRLKLIQERYNPQIIIYDVTSGFDILSNDNVKYLGDLKKFYSRPKIMEIFKSISSKETIKMYSNMYRHNSTILNTIGNYIKTEHSNNNGYLPMYKKMEIEPKFKSDNDAPINIDNLKLHYIEKFITDCKDKTQLIFVVSPQYFQTINPIEYNPINEICKKHNIPFLQYQNDSTFNRKKNLFSDSSHLNDDGATLFTKKIVAHIKELISNTNQ